MLAGHIIISPVRHDGDVYRRTDVRQTIYGALSVPQQFGLDCRLLTEVEIIKRALKGHDFKRIKRCSDGKMFDVAILHDWPLVKKNPCSCAIYLEDGVLRALNIEPKAPYNKPSD